MLTHRPCESSRLKACGFCRTLRHETPYGVTKRHEKCNIGEALYNLRRESVLEFEFRVRVRERNGKNSILPLQLVT